MPCPKEVGCERTPLRPRDYFRCPSTNLMVRMEIQSPWSDYVRIHSNNSLQIINQSSFTIRKATVWESKTDDMLRVYTQPAKSIRLLPLPDFAKSNVVLVRVFTIGHCHHGDICSFRETPSDQSSPTQCLVVRMRRDHDRRLLWGLPTRQVREK